MKKGGQIIQKTDDENFYAFSLESYKEMGFDIVYTCEDYKNPDEDDAETEHERHFKDMGKRIYRIKVVV